MGFSPLPPRAPWPLPGSGRAVGRAGFLHSRSVPAPIRTIGLPWTMAASPAPSSPAFPALRVEREGDRRERPTPRLSRHALGGGRRRIVRRAEEREGSFVDLHGWRLWCLVLWVALMNIGDSYFTLVHLQAGGIELNPVAAALLRTGRFGFVFSKAALIALALIVLAVHKNFFLARIGLWTATGTYTALVLYHLSLF